MNSSIFKKTPILDAVRGQDGMYHYLYKIFNKANGKYYIGVHNTTNINDGYAGSGTILQKAFKKYGEISFERHILEYFNTLEEASAAEATHITPEMLASEDCYNVQPGGRHVPLKTVTCRDLHLNKNVRVSQEEYYAHPERYSSHTKGQIKATDSTGKIFMANIDDPRFKTGEIWDYVKQFLKNTFPARIVATGQNIRAHINDPRILTGEIVAASKGWIKIHRNGEVRTIDPKHLKSFLDSGWERGGGLKGIKRGPSKVAGRCHIWKNDKVLIVMKNELDKYLSDGWRRGNGPRTTLVHRDSECRRVQVTELDKYLSDGWRHGNPVKSCAGKIAVHKKSERKFIRPDELDKYLSEGWQRGLVHKRD